MSEVGKIEYAPDYKSDGKDIGRKIKKLPVVVDETPSDAERLQWVLRYGYGRTLGTYQDFDYISLTLDLIDNAIAHEKRERK